MKQAHEGTELLSQPPATDGTTMNTISTTSQQDDSYGQFVHNDDDDDDDDDMVSAKSFDLESGVEIQAPRQGTNASDNKEEGRVPEDAVTTTAGVTFSSCTIDKSKITERKAANLINEETGTAGAANPLDKTVRTKNTSTSSSSFGKRTSSKSSQLFRTLSSVGTASERSTSGGDSNSKTHFVINRYLSTVSDHPERKKHLENEIDAQRLYMSLKDAGEHSLGIVAISIWILNDKTGTLENPIGGWWRERTFVPDDTNALARLEDTSRSDYLPLTSVPVGVGITGERWANTNHNNNGKGSTLSLRNLRSNKSSVASSLKDYTEGNNNNTVTAVEDVNADGNTTATNSAATDAYYYGNIKKLKWRDLQTLLEDPDTAKGPRLECLVKAGMGKAAAVDVTVSGHQVMVLYFARRYTSDHVLNSIENQQCLQRSATVIASIWAMSHARRACEVTRLLMLKHAKNKLKRNLLEHKYQIELLDKKQVDTSISGSTSIKGSSSTDVGYGMLHYPWNNKKDTINNKNKDYIHRWKNWCQMYLQKFLGGNLQAPPALSWHQCFVTLLGCFVGLIILSAYNEYTMKLSDNQYELLIGPFGALMTLQYSLTSAPASQPRNVVLGQAVAGAVSMAITQIPRSIIPKWINRALAPAFAITAMTKLGLTHPPAGAHSVIYSSGTYNWMFYFLVVFASIISLIPAVVVNNITQRRQYPTYWLKDNWFRKWKQHQKQQQQQQQEKETQIATKTA